ncbi:MAG: Rho termination factor N-terminal domain-containing protein [Candidatus Lokiarchaeota archaeon]|nr:Rho termination factor N-terminal domain-containing protein [Candidatus Lokiarchaeota archaeon]
MENLNRTIDDRTYLKYLLPSLNVKELKEICREYDIKGYSKLKKEDLINFIIDSQSEEEIEELIKQKEIIIISNSINLALDKINGKDRESIVDIKIVNLELHEVEILFKGFNWQTTSYLSITEGNIDNPDRDCDCNIGANMGFCSHFWVSFIFSLKHGFFDLENWTLTTLPKDFENNIKSITQQEVSIGKLGENTKKSIKLIDESSEYSILMKYINESITLYEGEITEIEEKQSDFQGNITIYFLISIKNIRLGPRVQKKTDFNEDYLIDVKELKIRISENLQNDCNLSIGDIISLNGKLNKDNISGFIVKNIRKVQKI